MPLIKEGRVEKKGTLSMAYFNWTSRWLQVRTGELKYFKEEDLDNAINIIPLGICFFLFEYLWILAIFQFHE